MNDRPLLERYTGRRSSIEGELDSVSEPDGSEDMGAFGWLRGPRERAVMLELRKKDGAVVAVAYGFINRLEFSPNDGILLRCGQEAIRIKGRNLNTEIRPQIRLFQGITRHRVPWIQEADPATLLRADKSTVIVDSFEY